MIAEIAMSSRNGSYIGSLPSKWPRSIFLGGAAAIFDLFGVSSASPRISAPTADWERIGRDFQVIGNDFRRALEKAKK